MRIRVLSTNEAHRDAIRRLLREESHWIRIVVLHAYDVKLLEDELRLSRLLFRRLAAGTHLEFIVGEIPKDKNPEKAEEAKNLLLKLADYPGTKVLINPLVHAKLLMVESWRGNSILISSANLSDRALFHAYELGVEITDPDEVVYTYVKNFIRNIRQSVKTKEVKEHVV